MLIIYKLETPIYFSLNITWFFVLKSFWSEPKWSFETISRSKRWSQNFFIRKNVRSFRHPFNVRFCFFQSLFLLLFLCSFFLPFHAFFFFFNVRFFFFSMIVVSFESFDYRGLQSSFNSDWLAAFDRTIFFDDTLPKLSKFFPLKVF